MSKMEEEECEHEEIKAQRHAEESLEMKRQIRGRKCQCEVKPVPTELEYIVEGRVTSTAQRETGISNSLTQLLYAFLCRNTYQKFVTSCYPFGFSQDRKQKRSKLPGEMEDYLPNP